MRGLVDRVASGIWDIYGPEYASEPAKLAKHIGGFVVLCDEIPGGADGMLRKKGDAFEILVYKQLSSERMRFTVAHEIGHLLLHCGYIVQPEKWKAADKVYCEGDYERELQANEFARALLMPKDRFTACVKKYSENGMTDMASVARIFHVTIASAVSRAKKLKIII